MKVTITSIDPQSRHQILKSFITCIQGDQTLQQHLITHGVMFEDLTTETVGAIKQYFYHPLQYTAYTSTDHSIHLLAANHDLKALLQVLVQVLQSSHPLAQSLWARGISLYNLAPDQANDLKKRLEADMAQVTVTKLGAKPCCEGELVQQAEPPPMVNCGCYGDLESLDHPVDLPTMPPPMSPAQGIRAEDEIADPFVPRERLALIDQTVDALAASVDGERATQWRSLLIRLKRPLPTLNLLLEYSRQFSQGDVDAGYPLLQVLNLLASQPSGAHAYVGQGPFFSGALPLTHVPIVGPNPAELTFPFDWQRRSHCLFPAPRLGELFLGLSRLVGSMPQPVPGVLEAYWSAVLGLVEQTVPLGIIYSAAKDIFDHRAQAVPLFRQTLDSVSQLVPASLPASWPAASAPTLWATPNPAFPPPIGRPGFPPFPIPMPPGRTWDLCHLEQWDRTARLSPCAQALLTDVRYEIDDIFNLTQEVSRRACVGDEVEIRGRHLGTEGVIQFGRHELASSDILAWSNEAIRFVVPAAARGQHLSLCIHPNLAACSGLSPVCRLGSLHSSLALEVVSPPNIAGVAMGGVTVTELGAGRFRAEACTAVELTATIPYAERVVIRDDQGEVVWDSGDGEPRSIRLGSGGDARLPLRNLRESRVYTVEASTLCGTITESVSLEIYHAIHISMADEIRVGAPAPVEIRISCSALEDLDVVLSSSDPSVLPVPTEPWRIPAESSTVTGELQGQLCSEVSLRVMIAGHEARDRLVLVFDEPHVRSVSPITVTACSTATLTIAGDCFAPDAAANFIRLTRRSDSTQRSFPLTTIAFENPTNRGRGARATAQIHDLLPGEWTVQVNRRGDLLGAPFERALTVQPLPVVVNQFYSSPTTIRPCLDSTVTIYWEVMNAARVVLSGTEINADIVYSEACGSNTDSRSFTIRQAQTVQLQVWPIGGGEPTTRSLAIVESAVLQAQEVLVSNDSGGWPYPHTVELWTWPEGRAPSHITSLTPGQHRIVSLSNCVYTNIIAVSQELVTEYNRRYSQTLDARNPGVIAYRSVFLLDPPMSVLGREGRGSQPLSIQGTNLPPRQLPI